MVKILEWRNVNLRCARTYHSVFPNTDGGKGNTSILQKVQLVYEKIIFVMFVYYSFVQVNIQH